ncbi:MAG: RecQ family ATP-dependent DNA helicase [Cyclobacteriaceae bacterium]
MNRQAAEQQLLKIFGFSHFHDMQWQVIDNLLAGRRILFIEKTGFGKSLCFQFPATQLQGITIVFSPLIALMRDQVNGLLQKGIKAAAINSNQSHEINKDIIGKAVQNQLDIIYIAPERMENASWITAAKQMRIAMIVIDEAHCISLWGQNFRPNYRRIVNLVRLLPHNFPVLAITATATRNVQQDILEQVGEGMQLIRGKLLRSNLYLYVIKINHPDEKYYWMAKYMPLLAGKTGIIYTGTQVETEVYSNWLQFLNIKAAAYSGRLDPDSRKNIEEEFSKDNFDCVVSTNALGMGIDKPNIRFVIHTQIPQSPIHYYQEIGRAGRDGENSYAILLYQENEDHKLPLNFIESSKPSEAKYRKVIEAVKNALLGRNEIVKATNLKQNHVSTILADLIDQKIINEQTVGKSKKYFYNPEAGELSYQSFARLKQIQMDDFDMMVEYTKLHTCRMDYLCQYLGDPAGIKCSNCDNDQNKTLPVRVTEEYIEKLQKFRETYFPVLEMESRNSNFVNGVAASYYGITNVGSALHRCKYESGGDFPDWLLKLTLKAFHKNFSHLRFDLILYVPPTESGNLVRDFAQKLAKSLDIPISHGLVKRLPTAPQKVFQTNLLKKDNVSDKFVYNTPSEISGKTILLFDDILDSGYTMKAIGAYLTGLGANKIVPLVIARTVSGDY